MSMNVGKYIYSFGLIFGITATFFYFTVRFFNLLQVAAEIHTSEAPRSAQLIEEALEVVRESHDTLAIEFAARLLNSDKYKVQSMNSFATDETTKIFSQQWYAVDKLTGIMDAIAPCIPVHIEKLTTLPNEKENKEEVEQMVSKNNKY